MATACITSDQFVEERVAEHYGHGRVVESVLAALEAEVGSGGRISAERLAGVDEFHTRGRAATEELLDAMGLRASDFVLDVGCGLGGAARHVAARAGCDVVGLDLVEEYVQAAVALSARCGLSRALEFVQGTALALPFSDGLFDAAITQHACMNIADKAGVYAEVRRVLRPGGLFGIYDVCAGPDGDPFFPVPWAPDGSTSFLAAPEEVRALLEDAGFEILSWRDRTVEVRAWIDGIASRAAAGGPPPHLGFHLLLGDACGAMLANLRRSLVARRVRLFEIVCRA